MHPTSEPLGHVRAPGPVECLVAFVLCVLLPAVAIASCGGEESEERVHEETFVLAALGDEHCVERTVTLRTPASAVHALDAMREAERAALYPVGLALGLQFSPNQRDCLGESRPPPAGRCDFPATVRPGLAPGSSVVSTDRVMLVDPSCSARLGFGGRCRDSGGRLEESPAPCVDPESPEARAPAPFASGTLPSRIDVHLVAQEVRGGVPRSAVLAVLRAHIAELRFCYAQALISDATVAGTVRLELIVSSAGRVNGADATAGEMADPRVARCVEETARHWTFSPTSRYSIAAVRADIAFASNGEAPP